MKKLLIFLAVIALVFLSMLFFFVNTSVLRAQTGATLSPGTSSNADCAGSGGSGKCDTDTCPSGVYDGDCNCVD